MPDGVAALCAGSAFRSTARAGPFAAFASSTLVMSPRRVFPGKPASGCDATSCTRFLRSARCRPALGFCWRTRTRGIEERRRADSTTGYLPCRWIVGADGVNSGVRRWAGPGARPAEPPATRASPAFSRETLDGLRGGSLGEGRAGLCDAGRARGSLRRAARSRRRSGFTKISSGASRVSTRNWETPNR